MPPHRRILGASMAGILNSDARNDEEAKGRVIKTFGSVLGLLFLLDVACAFTVLVVTCSHRDQDDAEDGTTTGQCVTREMSRGFTTFHPMAANDGQDTLGDLFALAVIRCIVATVLLWLGIKYGSPPKPVTEDDETTNASTDQTTTEESPDNSLTEPLLNGQSSSQPEAEAAQAGPATCIPCPEATTAAEDAPAAPPTEGSGQAPRPSRASGARRPAADDTVSTVLSSMFRCKSLTQLTPPLIQTLVLGTLFVLSSYFQVYAGLKVSTLDHPATESIIPLLCLTVFWINAQAYVFRTLLTELTREEGLYLPPEVHRHPMYFENSRSISVHWCDLCHRPIGGRNATARSSNNDESSTACYRCALCDFDVCLACAKRNDAATVGENVLRGDRGVRVEEALTTTGYVKRSMQVAKAELPLLLLSFLLLGATSVSRLLLPHFQGHIIDKVIPDPHTGHYDKAGFLRFIQIYIGIMVAQGAVSTFYSAILTLVSRRLKFTLRNALLEKILIQDVAYFDGTESGRLISRLTNDLDLMMAPIQSSLSALLSNLLLLFGGLIMCFCKSYRLSMISFITIGPISTMWSAYATWSRGLAREMLSYWAEGNSIAAQALSHVRTVKAFGCEDQVLQKYSGTNQQALNCGVKDAWGNAVTSALTGYLDLGSGVLILYFGGLLVYRGELSVGELVTFQLFWNMMNNAFQNLQGLITSFTRSAAGAEKVFSMWDSHPDIDPQKGTSVNWKVDGHLQLQNVSFYYQMRPDNIVLNKFNLDIPAGKTIALVGRSGGGKSTIINLLLRFYDPRGGKLVLDGRDYESIKVHELRRLFGVVTQETELFALTLEENIAYGLRKEDYTMEEVVEAAKKAYAHDFISEMKDGYQTRIGERGNRLSGGQRQRLAIARVFLRKPRIILLDEATSALDENSQEAVQQALANLIAESQATVVLVAHRLSTVVNADSICVIDKGSVLEQGNHEELVAKGGVYASMVEKQLKKKEDMLDQEKKGGEKKDSKVAADDIDALLDEATAAK